MEPRIPDQTLLAGGGCNHLWATSPLAVVVRCIFCVVVVFSRLRCPLRFQNSPQTGLWEGFLLFGNFFFRTPSPGQVSIPNSFVSLFIFYILSYLLVMRMGCLSGCLVSSASIQKLFCESCSAFKWSFDELVREKVVFPSYSSTILGLPPLNPLRQSSILHWVTMEGLTEEEAFK